MIESRIVAALAVAGLLCACGGTEAPPEDNKPTPAEVRTFWGLQPGSCWRYKIPTGTPGFSEFATVEISAPNDKVVAGRTVYIQTYKRDSGLEDQLYFDTESNSEIRLARSEDGPGADRVTRVFETEPLPLFGAFRFEEDVVVFKQDVFETTATPRALDAELHKWVVFAKDQDVATADGTAKAYKLRYTRGTQTAEYFVVPGYGFAKFTDFDNKDHQVCAARVCDSAGACTGASSCEIDTLKDVCNS